MCVSVWDRATLTVKNSQHSGMLRNNNTRVPVQEEEDLDDLDEGGDVLLLCHVSGPSFGVGRECVPLCEAVCVG